MIIYMDIVTQRLIKCYNCVMMTFNLINHLNDHECECINIFIILFLIKTIL